MACNCLPSPVAERAMADAIAAFGGKVWSLGIVAGAQHSSDCHRSSHNCACTCGGQESGNYDPRYAHADDFGHKVGDTETADAVAAGCLADPRCRYIIRRAILIHPDGSWSHSEGHFDHVHSSWLPGTTFDIRPFNFNGSAGDDAEMLSTEAQKWLDQRDVESDNRAKAREEQLRKDIVADVTKALYGTKGSPSRLIKKFNRLLTHMGIKADD